MTGADADNHSLVFKTQKAIPKDGSLCSKHKKPSRRMALDGIDRLSVSLIPAVTQAGFSQQRYIQGSGFSHEFADLVL